MKPVMSHKPNRNAIKNRRQKQSPKEKPKKLKTKSTPAQDINPQLKPYEKYINVNESAYYIVFELGNLIGFSTLMLMIIKAWKSHNAFRNKPNSNVYTVGPVVAKVVKCKCGGVNSCKWCCGSGWLTRHVSKVKEIVDEQGIII